MEQNIKKYMEGIATEEEQKSLLNWLRDKKNRALFSRVKNEWSHNIDSAYFPGGGEESWNELQGKLWQKSFKAWQVSGISHLVFRYAAIFLFILAVGSLTYNIINRPVHIPDLTTRVIADKGQILKVELPDGSVIWLNSGSEVIYSNHFASKNREISLIGEAFFMVSKNTELPFIVECNEIQIEALGTQFNVSAYPTSDFVEIVLEEGSVELRNKELSDFRYVLELGKMARFNKSEKKFNVSDVNVARYTSWKEGIMHIYDQPLSEVVKRLEMRYNQKLTFEDRVKDFRYTFSIKNEQLGDILRLMEKITPVKAIQQENVITFTLDKNKVKDVD